MEKTDTQKPPEREPWIVAFAGLLVFYLAWRFQGDEHGFWLPGLGVGIALISWLGLRWLPALALVLLVARRWSPLGADFLAVLADTTLHTLLIASSWWLYHNVARGSRWLDDPRSATLFLLIIPGGLSALFAVAQAVYRWSLPDAAVGFWVPAAEFWLSRMVGTLVVTPFLIVVGTPFLIRFDLVSFELPPSFFGEREKLPSRFGDRLELAGLTITASLLAVLLLRTQPQGVNWVLWACCLVLIVWTCIRQGLRGGCFAASITSAVVLAAAQFMPPAQVMSPAQHLAFQSAVQGHLLAFCSSALLVGVSASWIRANEIRYRHVVSRIPFVVYSARLPVAIPSRAGANGAPRGGKGDVHVGPSIGKVANVMLVSPASKKVFECEPEDLIGPFADWLERIEPDDRELVIASLAQLCLQNQPVTCEYRLRAKAPPPSPADASPSPVTPRLQAAVPLRWMRDTMTPHYSEDGLVDGWDGLVEDISNQRALSHNLRKMTNMLQVLITNLPTGVYFVQAPQGYPILVNARARQLLGQREDLSAGLSQLSHVFRLHRPDGTEYPSEELPVCKALQTGVACRASDIVVHRADGRKTPLITWAAPIDLHNTGTPDAAVWVLEDWSAMQQAENALRESEVRLRAVIETMDEGVIVQDSGGGVVDCNAAACTILGLSREQLIGHTGLGPQGGCLQEDGSAFPREQHPDQRALRDGQPARGVVLGLPARAAREARWILVNALPLPVGPAVGLNHQKARVVTTFSDITQQRQALESLRLTWNKYQTLVETLPFMLLQRDKAFNIIYLNPAATEFTGHTREEMMQPGFCESLAHPEDRPAFLAAAEKVGQGISIRIEGRMRAKDGTWKTALGFIHPNFQHGEMVGSTTLVVDMTMQRRLEKELQLARHLELVGQLASGTVHDFNNLLTILLGIAGLAKSELATEHPVWQHLSRIEEVGAQAGHLTGQLLTFSKQRPRQIQPVDLNAIVTQTLKLAQSVMKANITLVANLEPGARMILGEDVALKQVVMNLLLNARDAMTSGGTVTIQTDRCAPPTNHEGKPWVHLTIHDTGHGMPEQVRNRVFEPFFSTKEHGTGLGLAVVQRIIKEFGGQIDVWSEPGKGTRFDIWLIGEQPA